MAALQVWLANGWKIPQNAFVCNGRALRVEILKDKLGTYVTAHRERGSHGQISHGSISSWLYGRWIIYDLS